MDDDAVIEPSLKFHLSREHSFQSPPPPPFVQPLGRATICQENDNAQLIMTSTNLFVKKSRLLGM